MKKVLAFVITIAILLTSFGVESITALAQEDDDPLKFRVAGQIDSGFYDDGTDDDQENGIQTFGLTRAALAGFGGTGLTHNSRYNTVTKRYGIDVSHHNGIIDWNKVKAAGVEFAIIRVGYRGYEKGVLQQDNRFKENLSGAIAAGIPVGVYIFSQALNAAEAQEEADYACNLISGYNISLPVVMDYEYASNDLNGGRLGLAHLSKEAATNNVLAFCDRVKSKGYNPMVYANADFMKNQLNASEVSSRYPVWLANYTVCTSYAGDYDYWQYSSSGHVDGISTNVDCNVWYDSSINTTNTSIEYQTHIQDIGWQRTVANGSVSGTVGQGKRIEAISIAEKGNNNLNLRYRTHIENVGWESDWKTDGQISGSTGQDRRIEAIQIELTGDEAANFDVYYCVHVENYGWLYWASNGEAAGTTGYGCRIEAIKIVILPKGSAAPAKMGSGWQARLGTRVEYQSHVQDIGWQSAVKDGEVGGTTGQAKQMEAIAIALKANEFDGTILFKTHIQDIGWESDWKTSGEISGTTGQGKRVEAIQIQLTGTMNERFDVYYRTHCEEVGWTGWAKDGESCGTAGYGYRMEAIQILLYPKGNSAPGSNVNSFYQK